jgi:hypothetical protein
LNVIYVSGKYRADTRREIGINIENAKEVARELWKKGYAVICPHANTAFMDGPDLGHDVFIQGDLEMINRSDCIFMMMGWEDSVGAAMEYRKAVENGMPIYYRLDEVPDAK